MKKVSIMEAQHNLSKVLKQVGEGQGVYITRRKKVVARIVPPEVNPEPEFPDFAKRARKTWGEWKGQSSSGLLEDTRGSR